MDSGVSRVRGIVLAGSYPWSDSPLERLRPRPLLPVAHEPLISYSLRWLDAAGVREAAVCLNPASRRVRVGLNGGRPRTMALEFPEDVIPRGPAGCARDAALPTTGETFVVTDGTAIPALDLRELLCAHERSGAAATVVVYEGSRREGAPRLPSPVGIYVIERRALDLVPDRGFHDLKEDLIPRLHAAGEAVVAHLAPSACPRMLSLRTYLALNEWMLARLLEGPRAPDGYTVRAESVVHESACLEPGARIVGPALIGPDTTVRSGATLVGPAVLGSGCSVAAGAVVSRSVAWSRCSLGQESMVDGCVIADDAIVEAGSQLFGLVKAPARRRQDDLPRRLGVRVMQAATFGLRPRPAER